MWQRHLAGCFLNKECRVVGIDLSEQGIELARKAYSAGRFKVLAADPRVLHDLGKEPFDLAKSTKSVEHLYLRGGAMHLLHALSRLLEKLALAVSNKWDTHANPLWDGGHNKLGSCTTLLRPLTEAGFVNIQLRGAGPLP